MSQKHPTGQRLLRAAGITLALLGLTQAAGAQEATAQAGEALTVVKDAETGKLRAPTAAEAAALKAQADAKKPTARTAARTVATPTATRIVHPKGYVGYQLTDESMTMAVAVRKPDGSIERQCFDSHGAGADAVAKGHVHTNQAVTE